MASQAEEPAPERLRRAETVLALRSRRFLVVLEYALDAHNVQAVLRTAEAMGVQRVWTVLPGPGMRMKASGETITAGSRPRKRRKVARKITKGCERWMHLRDFEDTQACIAAMRDEGYCIWAAELSSQAICLDMKGRELLAPLPEKLAIVIGNEAQGLSPAMLDAADRRVYLPMFGFTESFNLSVATALILQLLFTWCPEARGDLSDDEKAIIREEWYTNLATTPTNKQIVATWKPRGQQGEVPLLEDLRRDNKPNMVPKKIRRRMEEAQKALAEKQAIAENGAEGADRSDTETERARDESGPSGAAMVPDADGTA
mmetsp:Transcript_17195/g.65638  ORF Transcript_17195/g.65638 Transcript_17195/m.65638 type:complete len:316 (-) Transcript_17195:90-1037(-)